jgi:hypothetical protein
VQIMSSTLPSLWLNELIMCLQCDSYGKFPEDQVCRRDATLTYVVAKGGTVRWNRHITPDLCLATSWLHDLIYERFIFCFLRWWLNIC